jgi:serine/threonine protein kinase
MEGSVTPRKLAGRYEVRQILGQGGMGLVYRAYDTVIRREVAVKTILDIPDPASLQLFYKECDVLASMSHPNIVEIFDIGEFEEDGKKKPYFVMPLLPGSTLDAFIRKASHRLTVERTVGIISQTCRGLQAAHDRGLVHRDLKPSNIFVMEDDSVKIIDFGVAHMTDTHSTRAQKGTLLYMSPEQIEMKPLSALSDMFSLSVVAYEALTGRHPFQRARADEIVEAIRRQIPPPASDINPAVSQSIGRVVHKGMAKQPWHRFSSAREFSDALNKALRNEPIEFFDSSRTRPRLERATKGWRLGITSLPERSWESWRRKVISIPRSGLYVNSWIQPFDGERSSNCWTPPRRALRKKKTRWLCRSCRKFWRWNRTMFRLCR